MARVYAPVYWIFTVIRTTIALFFSLCALGLLHAAPTKVDLGEEVDIEQWRGGIDATNSARSKGLAPLAGRRVEITNWHAQYSNLGQQRAAWSTRDRFPSPSVEYDTVEREVRPRTMSRLNRQHTSMRNIDHLQQRNFVDRYKNAPVGRLETQQDMIHDMVSELSLQDINRYQFRSSHNDGAGVPVRQPGEATGSRGIRTKSTEGEGELYIDRARSFFQTSETGTSGRSIPYPLSGSRPNAIPDGASATPAPRSTSAAATSPSTSQGQTTPPPPASEPRVETGRMFIEARVLD